MSRGGHFDFREKARVAAGQRESEDSPDYYQGNKDLLCLKRKVGIRLRLTLTARFRKVKL